MLTKYNTFEEGVRCMLGLQPYIIQLLDMGDLETATLLVDFIALVSDWYSVRMH